MATVRQVLKAKTDTAVHTIGADASVYEAIALMSHAGVGALVVTAGGDQNGAVRGIVTERDYARKVILQDKASRTTTVGEIMSAPVLSVGLATRTDDCMALMTRHRIRHLPVIEGVRLVGMVSIGDLVRHVIDEQQFAIDQLESYVRGPHHDAPTCALTRRSPLPQTLATRLA
ncbi:MULTISPECIES: CBS domain-containing protein [unclassified Caballeronia]|uniref:CBS domain-containing protein n=1 Tax=unclassified Caballeronia TaxID=2646786 RepID=UPI00286306B5|nr:MULTISPECIES: CBS domain-containing protein [unclassified Caballeronia]MDR5738357.1 CBS domain-containing protein [Caballeronia sp. LZ016]MDR5811787.1 CBS domain-containing protein [Caballeronia sp. LZ019]